MVTRFYMSLETKTRSNWEFVSGSEVKKNRDIWRCQNQTVQLQTKWIHKQQNGLSSYKETQPSTVTIIFGVSCHTPVFKHYSALFHSHHSNTSARVCCQDYSCLFGGYSREIVVTRMWFSLVKYSLTIVKIILIIWV